MTPDLELWLWWRGCARERPLTLSVLLEHQLPLLGLILVLSTPPVLSSFTCGRGSNILSPFEKTATNQGDLSGRTALIHLPCCFPFNMVHLLKLSAVNSWPETGLKATLGLTGSAEGR